MLKGQVRFVYRTGDSLKVQVSVPRNRHSSKMALSFGNRLAVGARSFSNSPSRTTVGTSDATRPTAPLAVTIFTKIRFFLELVDLEAIYESLFPILSSARVWCTRAIELLPVKCEDVAPVPVRTG